MNDNDLLKTLRNRLDRARRAKVRAVPANGAGPDAWLAYRAHIEAVELAERELRLARLAVRYVREDAVAAAAESRASAMREAAETMRAEDQDGRVQS